jgi:hypothetical protein
MISLPRSFRYLPIVALATLAACSGNTGTSGTVPQAPVATVPSLVRVPGHKAIKSWMHPLSAKSSLAYVADAYGFVDVFNQKTGTLEGQIATTYGQLAGIYVDKHHNVWVPSIGTSSIYEFARGGTTPIATLSDTAGVPYDITICPNGTRFVSNYQSNDPPARQNAHPDAARGSVEVFPPGATTPKRYLQYPDQLVGEFITCDKQNNVFTTLFYGASQSAVIEYAKGRGNGVMLPISLAYVGGIKAEDNGDILVGDQAGHFIAEYTEAGAPTGLSIDTSAEGDVLQFAVNKSGTTIGAADSRDLQADTWSFPGGVAGTPYTDPNFGYPNGFAYDPPAKP